MSELPEELVRLADAYGVATSYLDAARQPVAVHEEGVRAALAAMDVDTDSPEGVEAALAAVTDGPWRRLVRETVVVVPEDPDRRGMRLHLPEGVAARVVVTLEDGGQEQLLVDEAVLERAAPDGRPLEARRARVPAALPLGYHRVRVEVQEGDGRTEEALLVAAPAACPGVERVQPSWGWMLQLYAMRSSSSWGIGDLADLAELVRWSGADLGADFVVANPLHAAAPTLPIESSPYYPSSRRFVNPLYLRIEDLPAYAAAPGPVREAIDRLGLGERERNRAERIDRDAAWQAKIEALELLHGVAGGHEEALAAFRAERGAALTDFATFCALAERHGTPWQDWPEALRHPHDPAVRDAREELAERVAFHEWLQLCCDRQLGAAQRAATDAGMDLGIIHDLAVGVDPGGADGWALQDDLARDVTVGAPPDLFNQRGQDWRLPPLRPDRLAATGYAPFRDMMAAVLRHAGGIRIDHVMGLFRLWWVPEGRSPALGTYVRYPASDLLAILALEAQRADAVVVGEDLGTVEDAVREALSAAGVFGSRVLYFERTEPDEQGQDRRLRAEEYPAQSLASISTHDLPTAAGWWADEATKVQAELDLLGETTTLERELARQAEEKAEMRELLVEEGVLEPGEEDPDALREAMHAFLARCGSLLVAAQPADAIGDLRQPNMPGTVDEYPNWRLPIADPAADGDQPRPVLNEELMADERVRRLAELLAQGRRRRRAAG